MSDFQEAVGNLYKHICKLQMHVRFYGENGTFANPQKQLDIDRIKGGIACIRMLTAIIEDRLNYL